MDKYIAFFLEMLSLGGIFVFLGNVCTGLVTAIFLNLFCHMIAFFMQHTGANSEKKLTKFVML